MLVSCCVILSLFHAITASDYDSTGLNKYDHFVKKPSSTEILTFGRPTSRQITSIADAGFQSLLSVSEFATDDSEYNGVSGEFLSSENELSLARSLGLQAELFAAQLTPADAATVSAILDKLPKPVLVHCHVGYTASMFTLLHLVMKGQVNASDFITKGDDLGFNYLQNADVVSLINEVTNQQFSYNPTPRLELLLTNQEASYKSYYWPHRVGNDVWFNLGQPLDVHVSAIAEAGYRSVVSLRADGEPTCRLSSDPTTGPVNNGEFSDVNGNYNITAERLAFEKAGLRFENWTVSGDAAWTDFDAFLQDFVPRMNAIARTAAPVLIHCASGHRSSAYITTYLAYVQKQCTEWALGEALKVGFDYYSDESVLGLMRGVLLC